MTLLADRTLREAVDSAYAAGVRAERERIAAAVRTLPHKDVIVLTAKQGEEAWNEDHWRAGYWGNVVVRKDVLRIIEEAPP